MWLTLTRFFRPRNISNILNDGFYVFVADRLIFRNCFCHCITLGSRLVCIRNVSFVCHLDFVSSGPANVVCRVFFVNSKRCVLWSQAISASLSCLELYNNAIKFGNDFASFFIFMALKKSQLNIIIIFFNFRRHQNVCNNPKWGGQLTHALCRRL